MEHALRDSLAKEGARPPERQSSGAAGYDLFACLDTPWMVIPAWKQKSVPAGIRIAIPDGLYGRIAPRSGLAVRKNIHVMAGVVDRDFRGPLVVCLCNLSDTDVRIDHGDRVAQLVLERIATPDISVVDRLEETSRGEGGFGSTGR